MSRVVVPYKSWVIVCDGAKALFMQNDGDAELINLRVAEHFQQENPPARELGSDRPGRTHQSDGPGRSAMGETDFHVQAETDFLKDVAGRVNEMVRTNDIKEFILIAPPTALGILRQQLNPAATAAAKAELAKDLVKMPVPDIEKHLASLK